MLDGTNQRKHVDRIFDESDQLADELIAIIDLPPANDSARVEASFLACSLALEHWHSVRFLLRLELIPSALVVHRAQFEALVRSIWLAYAASDSNVSKFSAELSLSSQQAAKNAPMVSEMLQQISEKAPRPAYESLVQFKDNSWNALNSYTHSGIHPLQRHRDGYPISLLQDILRNTNGLGVVICMQAVVLSGQQPLQRAVLDAAEKHSTCVPSSQ